MNLALQPVSGGFDAQRAAADPAVSVWVAANAGAGKTRVLVDRVLRLMLAGTPASAILCLTFTKAAAAEMANRLYQVLGNWAVATDAELAAALSELAGRAVAEAELAPARRLFATTLDTPGGLRIQTIHAFCQTLLTRFPLEAGIAPHFEVMEERSAAEMLAEARDRVLRRAADGEDAALSRALETIVAQVDELAFAELVRELSSSRAALRRLLRRHGDDLDQVLAATRAALGIGAFDTAESIVAEACQDGALDRAGLERVCAALDGGSASDCARAEVIRRWLADPDTRAAAFQAEYLAVFLTQKQEARAESKLMTKAARAADDGALAVMLAEQQRLLAVLARLKSAVVADSTAALLRLAVGLLEEYEAAKSLAGLADYDDLILKASGLLTRPGVAPWVLYKLDGGLRHILVDEAQDTSPEQWQVVAALAEEFFAGAGGEERPRTIFAVGDEKQSIYSFQGADPAEFERMRQHFERRVIAAEQPWRGIELALSFRSTPEVLESVDRVFDAPAASAGVSPGRPVRHLAFRQGDAGLVEIWPTVLPVETAAPEPWDAPLDQVPADSPMARLAERIADTIDGWLRSGEPLRPGERAIRPGDVMILVRRRNAFVEHMVRALKTRSVPVAGTDRMILTDQIAVMDLMAAGRFALLPEDDLNLAVLLKSPLVGLSEELLFELAHGRSGRLWPELVLRRDERPEFAAAHDALAPLLARADFAPPFEFFAELLGAGGGRKRLLARLGPDAGDPVEEFLNLALAYERRHLPSIQGFLHWLEAGPAEIKRDLEQGQDEVRVMTVHGAKGLEAEIVFLPDTCAVPDARLDPKLLWQADAAAPLVFWPVRRANDEALCTAAREAARRRRQEEYRRLLYVAMTRARDRLYVCGWETSKGRAAGCWYDMVEAALKPDAEAVPLPWGETAWRLAASPPEAKPAAAPPPPPAPPPTPLPAWALRPPGAEPAPPRSLAPSRPEGEEPPVRSPRGADDGARYRRGRLIHRLLQTLPDLPRSERRLAAERFLARPAHRLDSRAQAEIAEETLRVLEDPACAALFGPGSRAEVPIAGLVGGWALAGQIDRLLVTDEAVMVVDFKSQRPVPDSPEAVAPAYLRQMASYRAALASLWPGREVRALLLWTDGPLLMPLPASLLDRWAP